MSSSAISQSAQNIINGHLDRLLASREYPKTVCPSEVARSLTSSELESLEAKDWRDAMPMIRSVAWQRKGEGDVAILQRGEPVTEASLDDVRGPIRLRKSTSG